MREKLNSLNITTLRKLAVKYNKQVKIAGASKMTKDGLVSALMKKEHISDMRELVREVEVHIKTPKRKQDRPKMTKAELEAAAKKALGNTSAGKRMKEKQDRLDEAEGKKKGEKKNTQTTKDRLDEAEKKAPKQPTSGQESYQPKGVPAKFKAQTKADREDEEEDSQSKKDDKASRTINAKRRDEFKKNYKPEFYGGQSLEQYLSKPNNRLEPKGQDGRPHYSDRGTVPEARKKKRFSAKPNVNTPRPAKKVAPRSAVSVAQASPPNPSPVPTPLVQEQVSESGWNTTPMVSIQKKKKSRPKIDPLTGFSIREADFKGQGVEKPLSPTFHLYGAVSNDFTPYFEDNTPMLGDYVSEGSLATPTLSPIEVIKNKIKSYKEGLRNKSLSLATKKMYSTMIADLEKQLPSKKKQKVKFDSNGFRITGVSGATPNVLKASSIVNRPEKIQRLETTEEEDFWGDGFDTLVSTRVKSSLNDRGVVEPPLKKTTKRSEIRTEFSKTPLIVYEDDESEDEELNRWIDQQNEYDVAPEGMKKTRWGLAKIKAPKGERIAQGAVENYDDSLFDMMGDFTLSEVASQVRKDLDGTPKRKMRGKGKKTLLKEAETRKAEEFYRNYVPDDTLFPNWRFQALPDEDTAQAERIAMIEKEIQDARDLTILTGVVNTEDAESVRLGVMYQQNPFDWLEGNASDADDDYD